MGLYFMLVSCGTYKRSSTETDMHQTTSTWQKQQNDKVITETIETTLDYYGAIPSDSELAEPATLNPRPQATEQTADQPRGQPLYSITTKKSTKTEDKGTLETGAESETDLKIDDETKENPWRPPWYVSGLVVIGLCIAYKVFTAKFQIIKRI